MSEAAQPALAYWSQEKKRKGGEQKRTTDSKNTQMVGIQGIIKEMCGGELVSFISG